MLMSSYGYRPVACPDTVIATVDSRVVEYHTRRVLGHGDHGFVYELQDAQTAGTVAAKVIPKAHLQQLKEQQQRLQQQLSLQQALQHEHIVRLLGSCEDSSNIYMLMELCTGVSIEDLLHQQGPFSEQQAATVLSQVLPAVAHLHQQGLAHGALQLSRLLLHSSGCIKLCGFGSAAQLANDGRACADVWCVAALWPARCFEQRSSRVCC
ncbi:kinase-like domain-containing protein [Scenedesmus sp. NREL 46B-D3]|nr:kinase-like domain-containing protein [Scenedesmus sp. NREL 46B-D3]